MENDPQFQEWLRPRPRRHVPLTHNFYAEFLRKNPGYNENVETPSAPATPNTTTSSIANITPSSAATASKSDLTSKLVKEIMESNRQLIEEAAMQKAATGVNVTTTQYKDLIPLSFDQEEFIKNHEASKSRKRSQ